MRPEHLLHQHHGLGALDLHGRDVDLVDLHVVPGVGVHPLRPEEHVRIGYAEPELVIGDPQEHGVVDDASVLVAQDHVPGLHRRHYGMNVAGYEQVDEVGGVRPLYLYLSFDRNVPHADVFGQVLVLLQQPSILGAYVGAGMVHVVVGCVRPAARRL